jgi:hypothetical protein
LIDIFGVIFWLSAWGSLAAWAAVGNIVYTPSLYLSDRDLGARRARSSSSGDPTFDSVEDYERYYKKERTAWQCAAAAAGLGALVW